MKKYVYTLSLLKLSLPIIAGQVGLILMGFFDNLMVGQLGHEDLAAAALANNVFFIIAVFGMGLSLALAPLITEAKAKRDRAKLESIYANGLKILFWMGIICFLLLFLSSYFFQYMGQEMTVVVKAKSYMQWLSFTSIPMFLYLTSKSFSDSYHYTKAAMIVTYVSLLLNIFLNWIFIYGNWGAPKMGLDGAGLATLISRCFMFVSMAYFVASKTGMNYSLKLAFLKETDKIQARRILKLGMPTALQSFYEVAAFALAGIMAGWISSEALAAHQAVLTIAALTFMMISGLATGSSILVGNALGKNQLERIKSITRSSVAITLVLMSFFGIVFILAKQNLVELFLHEDAAIAIGVGLMVQAALFQLSDGLQATMLGVLRGLKDTKIPSLFSFIAYWLVAIPLGYLLAFEFNLETKGIWIGLNLGLTISALLQFSRYLYLKKRWK